MKKQEILQKAYKLLHDIHTDDFKVDDWTKRQMEELFNKEDFYNIYDGGKENPEFKLFEELNTDTDIGWWNLNREKINVVIRLVNDWQTKEAMDAYKGKIVLAHIDLLKREEKNDLSDWQIEILDDIENFVNNKLD